jgi:heme/copper-type cytochrome/quinol oxidase subunit 2
MNLRSPRSLRPGFRPCSAWRRTRTPFGTFGWLLTAGALVLSVPVLSVPVLGQTPAFSISIRDNAFDPPELSVPAGQKIELHITNERAAASEFESAELRREKVVTPGQQVTVYVGPLRPGTYEFFDDFNPQTRGHLIAR